MDTYGEFSVVPSVYVRLGGASAHAHAHNASFQFRRLHIYPKGQTDVTGVGFFLNCIGVPPKHAVDFQLWVHNQQDTDKSEVLGEAH